MGQSTATHTTAPRYRGMMRAEGGRGGLPRPRHLRRGGSPKGGQWGAGGGAGARPTRNTHNNTQTPKNSPSAPANPKHTQQHPDTRKQPTRPRPTRKTHNNTQTHTTSPRSMGRGAIYTLKGRWIMTTRPFILIVFELFAYFLENNAFVIIAV